MTVGGIYNHFASKDEIWRAVVEVKHPYHQILPMIEQAQGETIDEILRVVRGEKVGTKINPTQK